MPKMKGGMFRMEKEELFKVSRENLRWLKENYNSLKRQYDSKWVIIHNKKVIQSSSTFNDIMNAAKQYDPNSVIVEYIESKPIAMFF
jgi:hypothetical protein